MTVAAEAVRSLRIGFVGAGHVGTALAWALDRSEFRVAGVAGRSRASAEKLARGARNCRVHASAQDLADTSDLVFLTVSDDVIAGLARAIAWRRDQGVVHCSGATEIAALGSAADSGAAIGGFHPLLSFTDPEAAIRQLPGCTIGIEAEEPLFGRLAAMAHALGCRSIALPTGSRPIYHASANFLGPFVGVLLNEAMALWSSFGADPDEACRALLPVLRGMVASIESNGPIRSLPGAIARADIGTIERHIEALRVHAPNLLPLYLELSRRTLPIAAAKGVAAGEKLRAIESMLAAAMTRES